MNLVNLGFYHLALNKLRFGRDFQRYAQTLTNSEAKPIRYIKTNGGRSFPFNIAAAEYRRDARSPR